MVTRQSQEIVLTRIINQWVRFNRRTHNFLYTTDEEAEIISYNDDDVLDNVKWGTDKL